MKILLMSPWQEFFPGTEQHVYTMSEELKRLGHEVSVFTFLKKTMWAMMSTLGVELLEDEIPDKFDLAIINGNNCLIKAPKSAFKIFISNGVVPSVEYPIPGADRCVSISEEVQGNLKKYGYESILIRNGVNCNRFNPTKKIGKKLKTILLVNNQISQERPDFQMINQVCNEMGLILLPIGLSCGTSQWEMERWMNESDLVISMGRGVYEAMPCGRNVIVSGYGRMVGSVNNKTYPEYLKFNCAGRNIHPLLTKENLKAEFQKYSQEQGDKNRKLALKYNNIENTVQNFLDLYNYRNLNI